MRNHAVLCLAILLAACAEPPPPPAPPKLVRVLTVGAGPETEVAGRTYSGEVRARIETTLGFRIGGKLIERLVDAGSVVKAGQPLARLDPADARLQAAQAEAQRSLAEADLLRYRDLKAKNFISASALDARETAFKAADAQAALAKNQATYTTLTADRTGVIGQVLAEPGQVVAAGQGVFRMAPDGEREVAITLPESEVAAFKVGQPAKVSFWPGTGGNAPSLDGALREIAPVADPVTRTYAARVSLRGADPRLPLGMSATVRFATGTPGQVRLAIPLAAIFQQGNQPAVWKVAADGAVGLQPVSVAEYGDRGAVVVSGLVDGDVIVAAGVNLLSPGEKVRIASRAPNQ